MMTDLDEASFVSTVPTDLTVTTDSEIANPGEYEKKRLTKQKQIENKKQLRYEVNSLKIGISQRNNSIEQLQAQLKATVKQLEQAISEKNIMKNKLENKLAFQEQGMRQIQAKAVKQVEDIASKVRQLEALNFRLEIDADDLKSSLNNLHFTETEYEDLKNKSLDLLTIKEYVALKIYREVWPSKSKILDLKSHKNRLEKEVDASQREVDRLANELEQIKEEKASLQKNYDNFTSKYQAMVERLEKAEPVIRSSEQTRVDRDFLLEKNKEIENKMKELSEKLIEENKSKASLQETQQQLFLLKKDKDYLEDQMTQLKNKVRTTEERLNYSETQLEKAERAKEEVFTKLVKAKEESENKMREEVAKLNTALMAKVERAQMQAKEMYADKLRLAEVERERYQQQRDGAERLEREAREQYQQLILQNQQNKINNASRISQLEAELRITKNETDHAEIERIQLEEMLKTVREDNGKLSQKVQYVSQQLLEEQTSNSQRIMELQHKLGETTSKLEVYNELELQLDNMVVNAAQKGSDSTESASRNLGILPSSSKRRLEHSLNIMNKLLQSENLASKLSLQLKESKNKEKNLEEELTYVKQQLELSKQPESYLLKAVQNRDDKIKQLKNQLEEVNKNSKSLEKQLTSMSEERDQLAQDLERLLSHREELTAMKKLLMSGQTSGVS